jgi:hypothetical protein
MSAYPITFRHAVEQALEEGMDTMTYRLVYDGVSLYLKVGLIGGQLAYLSAQVGSHGRQFAAVSLPEVDAAVASFSTLRGFLEASCLMANALLASGVWQAADLVSAWRGTRFAPDGICPQLEAVVRSPLDAIARLIERKIASPTAATGEAYD